MKNIKNIALPIVWQVLRKNRSRTVLTLFGITIGIALVIIVLSAGNALKGLVLGEVESFGDDWIEVEIKVPATKQVSQENAAGIARGVSITTLTEDDAEAIEKLDNIKRVYSGVIGQSTISYQDQRKRPTLFAVTPGFFEIDKGEIGNGRSFTEEENNSTAQIIVLGADLAEDLFFNDNPVGKTVKVDKKSYRVVGVMKRRGVTGFFNFDEVAYIPLKTVQKKIMGIDHVLFIVAQTINNDIAEITAEEMRWLVRERHDITDPDKDDFAVITMEESMAIVDTIFLGITWLLVGLAAISLAVAGVGIMNVMYVSVAERTFEIGLRKAVGASKKDILWQFLTEAIVITLFGGIFGLIIGVIISFVISILAQSFGLNWQFSISIFSIFLSLGFATAVGLIFGIYPAKKAASMDPIVAIRKE